MLKLESFGVDLLHTIGLIYTQKATTCLKSSKFLGLGGVWFRTKERGTMMKSAWGTMSSAIDASIAGVILLFRMLIVLAEKMSRMEEEMASGKYTEEEVVESMLDLSGITPLNDLTVKGKMLMVGWKATRLEVIQVIRCRFLYLTSDTLFRDVCDKLLDKSVPELRRHIRAQAILMIGRIFRAAERDPGQEDNGDFAFEQLLAASQKKKKKKNENGTEQGKKVGVKGQ